MAKVSDTEERYGFAHINSDPVVLHMLRQTLDLGSQYEVSQHLLVREAEYLVRRNKALEARIAVLEKQLDVSEEE